MLRKGYFEHQMEALRLSLARLLGVDISQGDVLRGLGATAKDLTGLELTTFLRVDDATLLGMFSGGDRARTAANAMISAKLLLALAQQTDIHTAATARRKAALLYAEALALVGYSAREYRAEFEALLTDLSDADWTPTLLRQAARGFEAIGVLDRAENYHFALRDAKVSGATEDAEAFYRRAVALDDDELVAGGLPRDEVEAALEELAS